MKLYIGGFSQGKLNYALAENCISKRDAVDAEFAELSELIHAKCIYRLNAWIRKNPDENKVNTLAERLISENPEVIVVCDEVGCGVIPMDQSDRVYRELVGRCLIRLAEFSEKVERVLCGIGTRIK